MTRRWIRLDCDWEESAWLDALTGQAAGCWPRLLCWVKLRGKGGRCKAPDPSVLARRWRVNRQSVDELIQAALEDEAIVIEGDELQVTNWRRYDPLRPSLPAWLRRMIMERDEGRCRYCGRPAEHVDHVLPYSRGGSDDPGNLVAACAPCNLDKRDQTPAEWRGVRP